MYDRACIFMITVICVTGIRGICYFVHVMSVTAKKQICNATAPVIFLFVRSCNYIVMATFSCL